MGRLVAAAVLLVAGCGSAGNLIGVGSPTVELGRSGLTVRISASDWRAPETQVYLCANQVPGDLAAGDLRLRLNAAICLDLGIGPSTHGVEATYSFESASSAQYLAFDAATSWFVVLVSRTEGGVSAAQVSVPGGPVERAPLQTAQGSPG